MNLARALAEPLVDPAGLDLDAAEGVTYRLHQRFRYEYDGPVEQLRHRLVVVPPPVYGNAYRRLYRVDASLRETRLSKRRDEHGNLLVHVYLAAVPIDVEFEVVAVVQRVGPWSDARLPVAALHNPRYLRTTRLTAADDRIRDLAADVRAAAGPDDREFGLAGARRVRELVAYAADSTSVRTTAIEALGGGRGVCQDQAHVLLAVCRAVGVPARYVSGHLLGTGGTHAWIEVIVPDGDAALAYALDPCHGARPTVRYLTIATGRDYRDVAPTSGRYVGSAAGRLLASRQLGVLQAA